MQGKFNKQSVGSIQTTAKYIEFSDHYDFLDYIQEQIIEKKGTKNIEHYSSVIIPIPTKCKNPKMIITSALSGSSSGKVQDPRYLPKAWNALLQLNIDKILGNLSSGMLICSFASSQDTQIVIYSGRIQTQMESYLFNAEPITNGRIGDFLHRIMSSGTDTVMLHVCMTSNDVRCNIITDRVLVTKKETGVHTKTHNKGGWSQNRFARISKITKRQNVNEILLPTVKGLIEDLEDTKIDFVVVSGTVVDVIIEPLRGMLSEGTPIYPIQRQMNEDELVKLKYTLSQQRVVSLDSIIREQQFIEYFEAGKISTGLDQLNAIIQTVGLCAIRKCFIDTNMRKDKKVEYLLEMIRQEGNTLKVQYINLDILPQTEIVNKFKMHIAAGFMLITEHSCDEYDEWYTKQLEDQKLEQQLKIEENKTVEENKIQEHNVIIKKQPKKKQTIQFEAPQLSQKISELKITKVEKVQNSLEEQSKIQNPLEEQQIQQDVPQPSTKNTQRLRAMASHSYYKIVKNQ